MGDNTAHPAIVSTATELTMYKCTVLTLAMENRSLRARIAALELQAATVLHLRALRGKGATA